MFSFWLPRVWRWDVIWWRCNNCCLVDNSFLWTDVAISSKKNLLCYYGTIATERIRSIDLTIYNANWLNYPPDSRKHIILIIAQCQSNHINFNGFNMFSCNLEIFGKVHILHSNRWIGIWLLLLNPSKQICKSASSYYLIFRCFSQR